MADQDIHSVELDADLSARLTALAAGTGQDVSLLAQDILRSHVDVAEHGPDLRQEDESRWQQYLETGEAFSAEHVRARLRELAIQAQARPASP